MKLTLAVPEKPSPSLGLSQVFSTVCPTVSKACALPTCPPSTSVLRREVSGQSFPLKRSWPRGGVCLWSVISHCGTGGFTHCHTNEHNRNHLGKRRVDPKSSENTLCGQCGPLLSVAATVCLWLCPSSLNSPGQSPGTSQRLPVP